MLENSKDFHIEKIRKTLQRLKIDTKEMAEVDGLNSEYRRIRPHSESCNCWGVLSSTEEAWNWHEHHINKCLSESKVYDFCKQFISLIEKEAKRFNKKKEEVVTRIELKIRGKKIPYGFNSFYVRFMKPILFCYNSQELANKEQEATEEINKFSPRKKTKRGQNTFEEGREYAIREFEEIQRKQKEKLENQENLNYLENSFHQIYQKGKKYTHFELIQLQRLLELIEKETNFLKNEFSEAKQELQSVIDKIGPCLARISVLLSVDGNNENKIKNLDNYQLKCYKSDLEEIEKIIYLSEAEKNLFSVINDKLEVSRLENYIQNLKEQNSENSVSSKQKAENQQKISESEKKLQIPRKKPENENHNQPRDDKNNNENNEGYETWTYSSIVNEIQKLKSEIEALKSDKNISGVEKQTKEAQLLAKLKKLEELEKSKKTNNNQSQNPQENKFHAGWVIIGGISFVALFSIIILIKKNTRVKRKKLSR